MQSDNANGVMQFVQNCGFPIIFLCVLIIQGIIIKHAKKINLRISATAGVLGGFLCSTIYTIQLVEENFNSLLLNFATISTFWILFSGVVIGLISMAITEWLLKQGIFGAVTLILTGTFSTAFITYIFNLSSINTLGKSPLDNLTYFTLSLALSGIVYVAIRPSVIELDKP